MEVSYNEFNSQEVGRGAAGYYLEVSDVEILVYNLAYCRRLYAEAYKNTASLAMIDIMLDKLVNDRVLVVESPAGLGVRVFIDDITFDIIKCIMEFIHQEADGGSMYEAQATAILNIMNSLECYT